MKRIAGFLLMFALMFSTGSTAWSADDRETGARVRPLVAVPSTPSVEQTTSIVIGFETSESKKALSSALSMGARELKRAKSGRFYVAQVPPGADVGEFVRELSERPGVLFAEPDSVVHAAFEPNDPGYVGRQQWGIFKIGAPAAWDVSRGSGVMVAVIDTGVDLDHPDLIGRLAAGRDFVNDDMLADDDEGHGTHVAGIVGATMNNSVGVAGVANQSVILPVKVLGANGIGSSSDVADGISWAVDNGAKVINLSLGSYSNDAVINAAMRYAVSMNSVVVAAAGNDASSTILYPAAGAYAIGVSATDSSDAFSTFSNRGAGVDISAPGSSIYSTTLGGGYGYLSGTSMATPHVAGVVALIRQQHPTWSRTAVEQQLLSTAQDRGASGRDDFYGYGRVNAALAVGPSLETVDDDIPGAAVPASAISGTLDERNDPHDVFRIFLSVGETLTVRLDGVAGSDFDIQLFTPGARSIVLDTAVAGSEAATYPDAFSYVATAAGYHYLDTDAFSGRGGYSLTYTTTMPTGDLSGTVTSSGSALAGVTVSVPGSATRLTATDGTYLIAGMSTGTHNVTYSKSGYSSQTHSVTVSASGATQDIALLVEPPPPPPPPTPPPPTPLPALTPPPTSTPAPLPPSRGGTVTRVAGADRYVVAANLARKGWDSATTKAWPKVLHVVIANGEPGKEADPLTAAGLAGSYGAPVLLVQVARIPSTTKTIITEIAAKRRLEGGTLRVHIIGGTGSVPDARWNELRRIPGVSASKDRIGGADRYDVSAGIARRIISRRGSSAVKGVIVIAADNPNAFYDALAASPIAYANKMPMLSVRKGSVPSSVAAVLNSAALVGVPRYAASSATYIGAGSVSGAQRLTTSANRYTAASQISANAIAVALATATHTGLTAKLPDALTGGAFLGKNGGVMLFTDSSSDIRAVSKSFIAARKNQITNGWIIGGTGSVPSAQETSFRALLR